ncbi:serine/threonine-protein kinase [Parafrankia elaeagni]|uniref:serine/threonine-protein kinase n=1 Tax=Parafrankia elaeagni TaxID=222534 RepID=UPI0003A189DE|nr:protein kinase [Parafrankia elaeagni]
MLFERAQIQAALPGYEIEEPLGRGSSGLVLAASHRHIRRRAAVKVLTVSARADRAGFRHEADVLAGLDHPHIVRIYDYVEQDELSLLVMESLPGDTLAARLAQPRPPVPAAEACALVLAAADALDAAHRAGVLHRDVKPTNMMFAADGTLKLVDFGISKFFHPPGTSVTTIAGTPGYMAPEQFGGARVGPGTDLYALGVVLYRLLCGTPPFGPSLPPLELWRLQRSAPPRPPAGMAPQLADLVVRALAPRLEDRFAVARDFATALAVGACTVFGPDWLERSGPMVRVDRELLDLARGVGSDGAAKTPSTGGSVPDTESVSRTLRQNVARPRPSGPAGPAADEPVTDRPSPGEPLADEFSVDAPATGAPREAPSTDDPTVEAPAGHPLAGLGPDPGKMTRRLDPSATPADEPTPVLARRVSEVPARPLSARPVAAPVASGTGELLVIETGVTPGARPRAGLRSPVLVVLLAAAVAVVAALMGLALHGNDHPAASDGVSTVPLDGQAGSAASPRGVAQLGEQALDGGTGARAEDVAVSPDGIRVAVGRRFSGGGLTEPVAWRSVGGSPWAPTPVTNGGGGGAMAAVTFLPGSGFVSVGSAPAPAPAPKEPEPERAAPVAAVWTSPDGERWQPVRGTWSAPAAGPVGELGEVVITGDGALLAVGHGTGPRETERFWRSTDGGAAWEQLPVSGLDGPSEQHVARIVGLPGGRLLGAGTEPEAGRSITRLRWSGDGTDWRRATSELPRGALVHGLARLADGRVLAVGSISVDVDGPIPLVSVSDTGTTRWEGYRAEVDGDLSGTVTLFGTVDAGNEVLAAGGVSGDEPETWKAAVWSVELPPLAGATAG